MSTLKYRRAKALGELGLYWAVNVIVSLIAIALGCWIGSWIAK